MGQVDQEIRVEHTHTLNFNAMHTVLFEDSTPFDGQLRYEHYGG